MLCYVLKEILDGIWNKFMNKSKKSENRPPFAERSSVMSTGIVVYLGLLPQKLSLSVLTRGRGVIGSARNAVFSLQIKM